LLYRKLFKCFGFLKLWVDDFAFWVVILRLRENKSFGTLMWALFLMFLFCAHIILAAFAWHLLKNRPA